MTECSSNFNPVKGSFDLNSKTPLVRLGALERARYQSLERLVMSVRRTDYELVTGSERKKREVVDRYTFGTIYKYKSIEMHKLNDET